MQKTMSQEFFTVSLFRLLEETFDTVHSAYLDKGTSLLETLANVGAEEASIPVGDRCATIAAQIEHIIFYLEVLEKHITGPNPGSQDWGNIWSRVGSVSEPEWERLKDRLKAAYEHITDLLRGIEDWDDEEAIRGSMSIVIHTAYHLGEIRQALCTVGKLG